tara:strand:+ start:269 stop:400 length:132 start_codon:yes stop_codon:yes gene_type:complete
VFVVLEALLLPAGEQALVGVVEQPVGPTAAQELGKIVDSTFAD